MQDFYTYHELNIDSRSCPRLSRHDLAYQALKVGINTCPANDAEQIRKELNALKVSR